MKLTAIMPARNEDWIIGLSLRVARLWCDEVILLAHACEDRTVEIAEQVHAESGCIHIIQEESTAWDEMRHRQLMLEAARERGATHIALVDADEVLTGNALHEIRTRVEGLSPGACLQVAMFNMAGLTEYITDAPSKHGRFIANWGNATTAVAFRDAPGLGWAAQRDGYQHHHREPMGACGVFSWRGNYGVMHYQFANRRRIVAKHALYKMVERLRWPAKSVQEIESLYNLAIKPVRIQTRQIPGEWVLLEWFKHIDLDGEPWQERECRRLWTECGAEAFAGLDLFGVCEEVTA